MNEYDAPERTLTDLVARRPLKLDLERNDTAMNWRLRREVHNMPLPVPWRDWEAVITGHKTQFRSYLAVPSCTGPRPCLLFTQFRRHLRVDDRWEAVPAVLKSVRREPLGAITAEDLDREGFLYRQAFRYYWKTHRYPKSGWEPRRIVTVFEVCPWDVEWTEHAMEQWLLNELYGEWLER